jgi:hypothetical protein
LEDGKSKFVALIELVIGAWRRVGKELSWGFSSERPGCSGRPIRALAGSPTAGQHEVLCAVLWTAVTSRKIGSVFREKGKEEI